MLRPDREPRGEDPMLLPKMALFFVAAVVAITGMVTGSPWVIFAAIVILAIGFLLRFLRPRTPMPPHDDDASAEEDAAQ